MRRWAAIGLVLGALWLFVRGVALEPIRIVEELLIGLAVGIPMAYLFRRFYTQDFPLFAAMRSLPLAIVYVVLFLWELVTANLDVAYRVLHPSVPIRPDVVEIPLRVQTDLAITTIANSITLTPGTLTMDYDEDRHALYVHSIAAEHPDAVIAPIRRWEDYALRIFAEPLDPEDPVPDPDRSVAEEGGGEDGE